MDSLILHRSFYFLRVAVQVLCKPDLK